MVLFIYGGKIEVKSYHSIIFVALFSLYIYTGLSKIKIIEHEYSCKGESEHWTAEYKVKGKGIFTEIDNRTDYDSQIKGEFILIYKGELSELSSVKKFNFSFQSSFVHLISTYDFELAPPTSKIYKSYIGDVFPIKDEIIKVIVTCDEKTEAFDLKNTYYQ